MPDPDVHHRPEPGIEAKTGAPRSGIEVAIRLRHLLPLTAPGLRPPAELELEIEIAPPGEREPWTDP